MFNAKRYLAGAVQLFFNDYCNDAKTCADNLLEATDGGAEFIYPKTKDGKYDALRDEWRHTFHKRVIELSTERLNKEGA